jgi:two-component system, chemotaxis family, chemotaxis protein CheY
VARLPKWLFPEIFMGKNILLVDDAASIRQVVGITLKGAGYNVVEAEDGSDALSKLEGQTIHLIISDVAMPNMDGLTFVRETKKLVAYQLTPIIMLITEAQASIKEDRRVIGVKAWVVKPFQPAQMLAAVSKLILP